jgi:hypothetical protein
LLVGQFVASAHRKKQSVVSNRMEQPVDASTPESCVIGVLPGCTVRPPQGRIQ